MSACVECREDVAGDWCLGCLLPVPTAPPRPEPAGWDQGWAGGWRDHDVAAPGPVDDDFDVRPVPVHAPDRRVTATAVAAIALGALVNIAAFAVTQSGTVEASTAIRIALWATLGFYGIVAALVVSRAQRVAFRPLWTRGDPGVAVLAGAVTGLGMAVAVFGLVRLATGEVAVDGAIALIVSERTVVRVGAALLIAVVAAPVIEEFLFRGLVVESLRSKGARSAVMSGATLFSLWHLSGSGFFYYLTAGVVLGAVYWRLGLKASIVTHAVFNLCVVLAAVAISLGPSYDVYAGDLVLRVPGGWEQVQAPEIPPPFTTGIQGPSGSALLVGHEVAPVDFTGMQAADLHQLAREISVGMSLVGVEVEEGSAQIVEGNGWQGIRMSLRVDGHDGDVLYIPRGSTLNLVVFASEGSDRAADDFEAIVETLAFRT